MENCKLGYEIPPLIKQIRQDRINLFEQGGGKVEPSFFTDAETAKKTIGLNSPMASGRMSISFAVQFMRTFFGPDISNRSSIVDLRNLRPVRAGDTLTISGKVVAMTREANGHRVAVELTIKNQNGDTTSAGQGSAVVPSGLVPEAE
jgi:acyl dehydratase